MPFRHGSMKWHWELTTKRKTCGSAFASWPAKHPTRKALEHIRDTFPRSFPGDLASLRLINLYVGRGEEHQAIRQIQQFLVNFPTHPRAAEISELLATLQAAQKSNQFFIAGVLPLSGKLAPLPVKSSAEFSWPSNQRETGQGAHRSVSSSKTSNPITTRFWTSSPNC